MEIYFKGKIFNNINILEAFSLRLTNIIKLINFNKLIILIRTNDDKIHHIFAEKVRLLPIT